MTYTKKTWANKEAGGTPVTAAELNRIEDGITEANGAVINVKGYGAKGDGTTDDTLAIQTALNAVPTNGGEVYFPIGDYLVTAPLTIKNYTLVRGSHVPQYSSSINPPSSCKIRAGAGFVGPGLIEVAGTSRSVSLSNIALIGNNIGTGLHGIKFPDYANVTGELAWRLRDMTIAGFTGSGIYGRLHVGDISSVFVHNNTRYGVECALGSQDRWNDVKVINSYFYFNRMGGCYFGGRTSGNAGSAYVTWTNCRFERNGQTPQNPTNSPADTNWNADAAGIRLVWAALFQFLNCTSDANTGPGFDVLAVATGAAAWTHSILFTNCYANRDGGGDQATAPADSCGYRVKGFATAGDGPKNVSFVNCQTGQGKSDDGGGGTLISPTYGAAISNTYQSSWVGPQALRGASANSFLQSGDNFGTGLMYIDQAGALKYSKGGAAATSIVA